MLLRLASLLAAKNGYQVVRKSNVEAPDYPADFTADEISTWTAVRPYTMTSVERIVSLTRAIEYLVRHSVDGDIVECGVWRGGSMMAAAMTLLRIGDTSRVLHHFDTFQGMTAPGEHDYAPRYGKTAAQILAEEDRATSQAWAVASLETVRANIASTGYPEDHIRFVPGRVEETLPAHAPSKVALLRLDTDWYESTRHELIHLYPSLAPGGVLIVDDYGHWEGARKAVDEFLNDGGIRLLLCRIDYTGRIAVKA